MIGKVIKPIPGTGYSIGDKANFDGEKYKEWFELGYIEPVKVEVETATIKGKETADIKASKKK